MSPYLSAILDNQPPAALTGENQHLRWTFLADGVLLFEPHHPPVKHVILSAGVHGNETAPVEILCRHVDALLAGEMTLQVRLLVILGNLAAMKTDQRFIDVDLNRLFSGQHRSYEAGEDTRRAALLEQYTTDFFAGTPASARFHLDLHTAIRESHYVRFGVLPVLNENTVRSGFFDQLLAMGLEALVVNPVPGGTFSYYTADVHGAQSCTLELGKARPFGTNDLSQFQAADRGLANLIHGRNDVSAVRPAVKIFRVCQELKKYSGQFYFPEIDDDVKNFSRFQQGMLIAQDGEVEYRVEHEFEWLIFPNAGVRNGLRAGMMLEEMTLDQFSCSPD
ncbi:Succinylglutamate desuccinylase [Vibrio aerogenes CECT 7868]|uniref:Succinylglutamate desuccinylase n=2 Tax=Vibrio aerogenes TaxID=92172 RepID=A0A1M5VAM4_9VIBR|nr:Succinylglutamate desuccinylase [Vibrio aerogenes CECT 7868]